MNSQQWFGSLQWFNSILDSVKILISPYIFRTGKICHILLLWMLICLYWCCIISCGIFNLCNLYLMFSYSCRRLFRILVRWIILSLTTRIFWRRRRKSLHGKAPRMIISAWNTLLMSTFCLTSKQQTSQCPTWRSPMEAYVWFPVWSVSQLAV